MDIGILFDLTLIFSLILSFGALSGYFSERAGIINIGINGMMIFGALFFNIFGGIFNGQELWGFGGNIGNWSFVLAIILSCCCTIFIGLLFGFATITLKANHIVVGTGINLLGASCGVFLTNPLGQMITGTEELRSSYSSYLKIGDSNFFGSSLILFVFFGLVIVGIFLAMKYTKFGLRFKSIGENPNAADAKGINVIRYKWIGVIISSILASIAGSLYMLRQSGVSFIGDVDSLGFLSLAIMVTGSWKIISISSVSIVFAFLFGITQSVTGLGNIKYIFKALPYLFTLLTMVLFSRNIKPPKAVGLHFDKSLR